MQVKPISDKSSLSSNDGFNKWVEFEIRDLHFSDVRLAKRFGTLLGMLTRRVGDSLPAACENSTNTNLHRALDLTTDFIAGSNSLFSALRRTVSGSANVR